ncbi:hypothetical protein KEJ27_09795 [Candidatus Bathyarchaeota archaeon]|nr:hypothetical protein [Candidatus Bathyarchaeota archaeon]
MPRLKTIYVMGQIERPTITPELDSIRKKILDYIKTKIEPSDVDYFEELLDEALEDLSEQVNEILLEAESGSKGLLSSITDIFRL